MKKYLPFLLLFLIILFSLLIRVSKLSDIPAGFNYDEATVSYNAYTLTKYGMDQSGKKYPLIYVFDTEQYHQALYFYLIIPAQLIFGVNKFSYRITAAFFGVVSVLLTYFLAKKLFNLKTGLISSILASISPWHIWISRSGYEIVAAQAFFLAGLLSFFSIKNQKLKILGTIAFFLLSALTYRAYLIFLPIFLLSSVLIYRQSIFKSKNDKWVIYSLTISFALLCIVLILVDPRRASTLFTSKISGSNLVEIVSSFIKNYLFHFSLFTNFAPTAFDTNYWMVNRGLYYLIELPLMFLGLSYLLKYKKNLLPFFLAWIILYPIPHSLTVLGSANRMFVISPLPQILSALGIIFVFKLKKYLLIPIIFIYLFGFGKFYADYFFYYPAHYGNFNHEGPEYLYQFISKNNNKYGRVIIGRYNTHPNFFLFFEKYDLPALLKDKNKYKNLDQAKIFAKMENIYFIDKYQYIKIKENDLVVDGKEYFPKGIKPVKIIYLQNGSVFAYCVEGKSLLNKKKNI